MGESIKGVASGFLGSAFFGSLAAAVVFQLWADECTVSYTSTTYDCVGTLNLQEFVAANGTGWGIIGAVIGWMISES